jgi:enoyl-CoA hydratase
MLGFRELQEMSGLRAVLFAAEGRVFSAGGDFDFMHQANADLKVRVEMIQEAQQVVQAMLDVSPPIVVALHGDAIGLGATLVLAADAVVTHAAVRIADPHVAIGLVAGDGGCLVWPQAIGMMRAKRHLLTGDPITGDDAYRAGLVSDLVERDAVPGAAQALAERLAALPPLAVQGTKRALNEVLRHRFAEVMPISLANELTSLGSEDLREAIAAFKERRTPTYAGR